MSIGDLLVPPIAQPPEGSDLWVGVPPGFLSLPIDDPATKIGEIAATLNEFVPEERRGLFDAAIATVAFLLGELSARDVVYCGLGYHTAEDGERISSSLVVSLQTYPARRDPRLVLADLVIAQRESGESGQVELADLENGPAMFVEAVVDLPTPQLPGQEVPVGSTSPVYQLQALVPAADGTRLAALEFSTPMVGHGTQFRTMMALMASTVSFQPPPGAAEAGTVSRRIGDILGG